MKFQFFKFSTVDVTILLFSAIFICEAQEEAEVLNGSELKQNVTNESTNINGTTTRSTLLPPDWLYGNSNKYKKNSTNQREQDGNLIHKLFPSLFFGNKKYYIDGILTGTFNEAWYFCKRNKMELLSLESDAELNIINKILVADSYISGYNRFFTSGVLTLNDERWIWMDTGKPLDGSLRSKIIKKSAGYNNNSENKENNEYNGAEVYNKEDEKRCLELAYNFETKKSNLIQSDCLHSLHVICYVKV